MYEKKLEFEALKKHDYALRHKITKEDYIWRLWVDESYRKYVKESLENDNNLYLDDGHCIFDEDNNFVCKATWLGGAKC